MSWHWILDDRNLGPTEKLVLMTIKRFEFNGVTRASQKKLAEAAGISVRGLQKSLASVETKGYRVLIESGKGAHAINVYRVAQHQGLLFSRRNFWVPGTAVEKAKQNMSKTDRNAHHVRTDR